MSYLIADRTPDGSVAVTLKEHERSTNFSLAETAVLTKALGICGTDRRVLLGNYSRFWDTGASGRVICHEWSGSSRGGKAPLEVLYPYYHANGPAGPSAPARDMSGAAWDETGTCGVTANGFAQTSFVVDRTRLVSGNDDLTPEFNALAQPFGVAYFGVNQLLRLAQTAPGATSDESALVIGAGTIGIGVVLSLLHLGFEPRSVTCIAKHDFQLRALEAIGVTPVQLSTITDNAKLPTRLVFETSGSRDGFTLAQKILQTEADSHLGLFDKEQQAFVEKHTQELFANTFARIALCRFCGASDMREAVTAIVPRIPDNFRFSVLSMEEFAADWETIISDPHLGKVFLRVP